MKRFALLFFLLASPCFAAHDFSGAYKHPSIPAAREIALDPPQTNTFCAANLSCTLTGAWAFSSSLTAGKVNGLCVVDGVQNATLAAAITCAGSSGVIEIPMFAVPTLTANATIPAGVTLRFDGPSGITTTGFTLTVNGPIVAPNTQIFFGTGTVVLGANVGPVNALWFPGADACARTNAANTALTAGAGGGIIDTAGFQGTQTCAGGFTLGLAGTNNVVFLRLGNENLKVGAHVLVYGASSIVGLPFEGANGLAAQSPSIITANASMANVIQLGDTTLGNVASGAVLRDVTINGNSLATHDIEVVQAGRIGIYVPLILGALSDGIHVDAPGAGMASNVNCCSEVSWSVITASNDGIFISTTSDWFFHKTQLENNGNNGIETVSSGAMRIVQCDFGANTGDGIKGTSTVGSQGFFWIIANQFNGNKKNDIELGSAGANFNVVGNQIIGNQFDGLNEAANTGFNIIETAGSDTLIEGNYFQWQNATAPKYPIDVSGDVGTVTVQSNYLEDQNGGQTGIMNLGSFGVSTGNVSRLLGLLPSNRALRSTQLIADQGTACANGELALSAGWQSTGSATVTAVAGNGQTCSWTITTGTTTAANPTVTDTLTNALPAATTVCEMNIHGGTHTAAAGEGFQQTALSATAPVFTFNGTPTAGGTTYFVTRRCGP